MNRKTKELQVFLKTRQWFEKLNNNISDSDLRKLKSDILNYRVLIDEIYIHCLFTKNRIILDFITDFGYDINKHLDFSTITKILTNYNVQTFKSLLEEGYALTNEMKREILNYLEHEDIYYSDEFMKYFTYEMVNESRLLKIKKIRERKKCQLD